MIPNLQPIVATYGEHHHRREVVAWTDDGDALVVDSHGGRLVLAESLPHFNGLETDDLRSTRAWPTSHDER